MRFGDVLDLTTHMSGVMASYGADAPGFAAVRQPITGSPDFPDVFLFSVFDDMTHWSSYVGKLFGTDSGQRVRNHMSTVLDCNISMWDSQTVIAPDED